MVYPWIIVFYFSLSSNYDNFSFVLFKTIYSKDCTLLILREKLKHWEYVYVYETNLSIFARQRRSSILQIV